MSSNTLGNGSVIAQLREKQRRNDGASPENKNAIHQDHCRNFRQWARNALYAVLGIGTIGAVAIEKESIINSVSAVVHPSGNGEFSLRSLLETPSDKEKKEIAALQPFVESIDELIIASEKLKSVLESDDLQGSKDTLVVDAQNNAFNAFNHIKCMQDPYNPAMVTLVATCSQLVSDLEAIHDMLPDEAKTENEQVIPHLKQQIDIFKTYADKVSATSAKLAESRIGEFINRPRVMMTDAQ